LPIDIGHLTYQEVAAGESNGKQGVVLIRATTIISIEVPGSLRLRGNEIHFVAPLYGQSTVTNRWIRSEKCSLQVIR
jgi:hypothetical protein